MTSDVDCPGMNAVAHRHFSSTSICKYYRFSGTCRFRRCGQTHAREAFPSEGAHRHEPLPSVQERPWVLTSGEDSPCDEGDAESWRFSVASYNILADKYAKHYRSYLYHDVPSGYLDWHHRKAAIVEELAHLQPDIVCLQEVDRYEDLEADLQQLGYSGIYLQRDGSRRDGCATFWRNSLLRPALVRQLRYSQYDLKDNVALLVLFQPHRQAAAAGMVAEQQDAVHQQQMQPCMTNEQLLQQQQHEQQQHQRHKQDLLSQWLPRGWLHNSHAHKSLSRAASLGHSRQDGSSADSIYQQPDAVMHVSAAHSTSWGPMPGSSSSSSSRRHSKSSKHSSRRSSRDAHSAVPAGGFGAGASWEQQQQLSEPLQLAPEWHNCGILVANTHIIFTPDKGEVKLGQARMLVQEAAQMAQWYLDQQQQRRQLGWPVSSTQPSNSDAMLNRPQHASSSTAGSLPAASADAPNGVVTIIAGDFNATPHSPMYTFMARGEVDLHRVNRRNVSHMASGGNHLHKGYKGFRRAQKRKSIEEQRNSLEQQQWQPGVVPGDSLASQLASSDNNIPRAQSGPAAYHMPAAAVTGDLAAVQAGRYVPGQQQHVDAVVQCSSSASTATAGIFSSPAKANSLDSSNNNSYPSPVSAQLNNKLYRWSDKECRRAAGLSYDELLEASSSICEASDLASAASEQPASPSSKIARAAAAFGARVAAGAGAAAASVAASAAAELGGPFEALRGTVGDGVGRLLLKHGLQLQSSYVSVLGEDCICFCGAGGAIAALLLAQNPY
eukprot:GHUV01017970.1.p1 GENE.GHUV01017970.1~~GHUV01017970.1.p1  ORF type:complete len:778 (+),score=281.41 GHUV01017970.1:24-2357(+)